MWLAPFRVAFIDPTNRIFKFLDIISCGIYFLEILKRRTSNPAYSFLDILASLPYSIIFYDKFSWMSFICLLKLPKLWNSLTTIEKSFRFLNPIVLRLLNLIAITLMISHWTGCLWYTIGSVEGFGSNPWVPSLEFAASPLWIQYIKVLYWGLVHITSVSGNTYYTTLEGVFGFVVTLVGLSVSASIIGNMGSLLNNFDLLANVHRQKINAIATYLRIRNVPSDLQKRIYEYHDYLWTRQRGIQSIH